MPVYRDTKTKRLYIEFQYRGFRYKERLPQGTTRATAEASEITAKNSLVLQSHGVPTKTDITFERFLKSYFGPHIDRHYSEDTLHKAIYVCKEAMPFFKGKAIRSIKPADVERFQAYRKGLKTRHGTLRKPATVLRELAVISALFSLAVKNDLCDYNPCSRVKKPTFDNIQDRLLEREDEDKFFKNMHSNWAKDICRFVLNTGLRQNDVMQLTRFGINREKRKLILIQGKTQRRLVVALNDAALEILNRRWHNGSKLLFPSPKSGTAKGSVRHAMTRACDRSGIPHVTIRDLRRTFATRGLEDGHDAWTVADALGHTSLRMIPRYVRSIKNKRKLVDSIGSPTMNPPEGIKKTG